MKKQINIRLIIFIILFFEISYILINNKKLMINQIQIDSLLGDIVLYKIYFLLIIGGIVVLLIYISKFLDINFIYVLLFLVLTIYLYIEYKLKSNSNISNTKQPFKNIKNHINTGDFIIYETPRKLKDSFCLFPVVFLNIHHIGICIKDKNNEVYILECDATQHYCEYSKKYKSGVVLLNLEKRLKDYNDSYLVKTNLHKYISNEKLINFIEEYKNKDYMENNINCITLVLLFLKKLNLVKDTNIYPYQMYIDYHFLLDYKNYTKKINYDIVKIQK